MMLPKKICIEESDALKCQLRLKLNLRSPISQARSREDRRNSLTLVVDFYLRSLDLGCIRISQNLFLGKAIEEVTLVHVKVNFHNFTKMESIL